MQNSPFKYYIYLFCSMFMWGGSFVLTKHLLSNGFEAITVIFLRCVIASIIFIIFCIFAYKNEFKIAKKDLKYFMGLAFFEPFVYFLFETYSLKHCDASVVSIIIATIPLFVALMAVFIFKEKLSKLNFFGIILSISGIVVMLGHNFLDAQYSFYIFLSFGAVLSTIGYNFFLRKIPTTYSPLVVITWQNIFGLLAFLPLVFIIENNNIETIVSQYNAFNDVLNLSFLLILSIFCSVIAFIFYISSLRVLGVARTNIFANLIPVMTLIIAFYVLNEAITINKVLGMIIVISGIFLVQFKRKQENHSKK